MFNESIKANIVQHSKCWSFGIFFENNIRIACKLHLNVMQIFYQNMKWCEEAFLCVCFFLLESNKCKQNGTMCTNYIVDEDKPKWKSNKNSSFACAPEFFLEVGKRNDRHKFAFESNVGEKCAFSLVVYGCRQKKIRSKNIYFQHELESNDKEFRESNRMLHSSCKWSIFPFGFVGLATIKSNNHKQYFCLSLKAPINCPKMKATGWRTQTQKSTL